MAEKRQHRKRSFIVSFCIVALCAWFAISLFSIIGDISKTKDEIDAVEAAKTAQEQENKELRKQLDNGDINEYAESYARDNLGYVMPGERIYYDVSANN